MGPSLNLMTAVQAEVAALRNGGGFSSLRVAYNGEVPNLIEEHDAILADLSLSSFVVFVLVGALIVFYFRSVRGVFASLLMLLPGLAVAFGIGRLTVDHLILRLTLELAWHSLRIRCLSLHQRAPPSLRV